MSEQVKEPDNARSKVPVLKWTLIFIALLMLLLLGYCVPSNVNGDSKLRALLVELRQYYKVSESDVAEVAKRLATPDAILAYVSKEIATSPYTGRLQLPEEVLQTRSANPADKAILLKALLAEISVQTSARATALPTELRREVFGSSGPSAKQRPEAFNALASLIGSTETEMAADNEIIAADAGLTLFEHQETVDAASQKAKLELALGGLSSLQSAYIDWVWLIGEDGTVYDPVLPNSKRPELWRRYNGKHTPVTVALVAEDAYARRKTVMTWQGAAYGKAMSIGFLPTVNPYQRLQGDPDMSDIGLWTPILRVGNKLVSDAAFTRMGEVASSAHIKALKSNDRAGFFDEPKFEDVEISNIDTSHFPLVRMEISAKASKMPRLYSGHFDLKLAEGKLPVRIEEPFGVQKPVIVMVDQSGSMENGNGAGIAREFGQTFVGNLSPVQKIGLFALRQTVHAKHLFQSRKSIDDLLDPDLWDHPPGGQQDPLDALDVALNAIMLDYGEKPEINTQIVLVTDATAARFTGEDYLKRFEGIKERFSTFNASLVLVKTSNAAETALDELAQATNGQIIPITSIETANSEAIELASTMKGAMVTSFVAPPRPEGYQQGETLDISLRMAGFAEVLTKSFSVPETLPAGVPALYLTLQSGENKVVRKLVALGRDMNPARLAGDTTITLAPGYFNINEMESRRYGRWLLAYDILSDNDQADDLIETGETDVEDMERLNRIANLVSTSAPEDTLLKFPLVSIVTSELKQGLQQTDLAGEDDSDSIERNILRTLDIPTWHGLSFQQIDKQEIAGLGLALNDAEARSLQAGSNLTEMFLNSSTALKPLASTTRADLERQDFSFAQIRTERLFELEEQDGVLWSHDPVQGNLNGYILKSGLTAKGSQDEVIAAEFRKIKQALDIWNVATSPMPGAAKIAYKGLIGFKLEELKLWCYSSIMLGYVNEVIAGEEDAILNKDTRSAETRAAELCDMDGGPGNFEKNLFKGAAKKFAAGWVKEFIRKGKNGEGGTDGLAKFGAERFTKDAKELYKFKTPIGQKYVEKIVRSATRKAREANLRAIGVKTKVPTPESISEKVTSTGLNKIGSMMGQTFSAKLAGAIERESTQ